MGLPSWSDEQSWTTLLLDNGTRESFGLSDAFFQVAIARSAQSSAGGGRRSQLRPGVSWKSFLILMHKSAAPADPLPLLGQPRVNRGAATLALIVMVHRLRRHVRHE